MESHKGSSYCKSDNLLISQANLLVCWYELKVNEQFWISNGKV